MEKPNILLVSLDAVRADHLFCYGYTRDTTPFLTKLSQQCIVCDNAYSASNWTLPSHASLFTSVSMSRHGIGSDRTGLRKLSDPRLITLAEYLRSYGYHTAAFTNCGYLSTETLFDRGFEYFKWMEQLIGRNHPFYTKRIFGKYWGRILSKLYSKYLYGCRDRGASLTYGSLRNWLYHAWKREQPFFAFVHLFESHAPYWAPEPFRSAFGTVSSDDIKWVSQHTTPWYFITGERSLTSTEFDTLRDLYDGTLLYQDHILERIFRVLQDLSVLDDTLVIVTADHGESLGEHDSLGHAGDSLYEPVIHIPLLIQLPVPFSTTGKLFFSVSHLDVFPTILSVLNHSVDYLRSQLQGISIIGKDQDLLADRIVVSESLCIPLERIAEIAPKSNVDVFNRYLQAVRWRQYKLILNSRGQKELYDLSVDQGERHDLSDTLFEIVSTMQQRFDDWQSSFQPYNPANEIVTDLEDEAILQRLRALGYLE